MESQSDKEKFVRTSMLRLQQQQMLLRSTLDRVHTHINRLMLADFRVQEFIVYDSPIRHYRGQLARQAPYGVALR